MNKRSIFFQLVLLIFCLIVYFSKSPWFIYFPKEYLFSFAFFSAIFQSGLFIYLGRTKYPIKLNSSTLIESKIWLVILFFVSFFLMIAFPIRNLNLGDGVLLLEHVALETRIFGFHLTMDEVMEAFIHSILYAKFGAYFESPMEVYRIVSTISGLILLGILFYNFRKFKISLSGYFIALSSGGIYLFHGYSENYTMITTILWFYILFSMQSLNLNNRRNLKILIPICLIACTLILFHLVSGYLIFSLVYLCYHFSDEGRFIQNAVYSTLFSLAILAPVFIYFSFFSEVRFDFTQTHLTNPKFYPISKIISATHIRDILFCLIASAFLPSIILLYLTVFFKAQVKEVFQRKDLQFLGSVLFGFLIHGFIHYPQLGFPADWDLLAFYWTPLSLLSIFILQDINKKLVDSEKKIFSLELTPIFLFSGFIFVMNAVYLNKPDVDKMVGLRKSLTRIDRFALSEDSKPVAQIKPPYKKFYLQVSFFLFESGEKIKETKKLKEEKYENLLLQNKNFKSELENNRNEVNIKWQKDYYVRLTKYHLNYLEFLKIK